MILRRQTNELNLLLENFPVVALLGPRQVGKTTLALEIAKDRDSVYLDLESNQDLAKLTDPSLYFEDQKDKLVILDEIQRIPELFRELRGIVDNNIRQGRPSGHFLILGSASIDLLKQSSESLAGRIAYLELDPLDILEIDNTKSSVDSLWVKGGFPVSYLLSEQSMVWRENFIRTYLERDIPQLGPRIPAETLRRFWTMLANLQGSKLNVSNIASSLGVDGKTVNKYLDLMVDLLLVRRLPSYQLNINKRLVKSPKIYVRDSGLVHNLLSISDKEQLLGHPIVGMSWEGFIIENILRVTTNKANAYFYSTASGTEMDLVLEMPNSEIWAIEVKRSSAPKLNKRFRQATKDIQSHRNFIVYSGNDEYRVESDTTVLTLRAFAEKLQEYIKSI